MASPISIIPNPSAGSSQSSPHFTATPAAPVGTPAAGWTPYAFATPVGTQTPDSRQIAGNDRTRFLSVHNIGTVRSALLGDLAARLSETTIQKREKAMEQGSNALDRLLGENGEQEVEKYRTLQSEKWAVDLANFYFGALFNPFLWAEDDDRAMPGLKRCSQWNI